MRLNKTLLTMVLATITLTAFAGCMQPEEKGIVIVEERQLTTHEASAKIYTPSEGEY